MKIGGIGIDIIEVSRFRTLLRNKKVHFVENIFTKNEQEYCFAHKDPSPHLAGMFAAKEAARKATGDISSELYSFEVRHHKTGRPEMWVDGKKKSSLLLSITHTRSTACAVVISQKS